MMEKVILACAFMILGVAAARGADYQKEADGINENWKFCREAEVIKWPNWQAVFPTPDEAKIPDSKTNVWEMVSLPHTARLEGRLIPKGKQWKGICWYVKKLQLSGIGADKVVVLRFEGAMNIASLYVNGKKVAEHADGWLPFVADISEYVKNGKEAELAVRLDNRHSSLTGPGGSPDFNRFHGLYRNAELIVKPLVHITDEILANKPASGGVFVTYPEVSKEEATVRVQTHVKNSSGKSASCAVRLTLSKPGGRKIMEIEGKPEKIDAGADRELVVTMKVDDPRLWSPSDPQLCDLTVELLNDGKATDMKRERIGIRRFEIVPGGIVFNGDEKRFMRGVNRHQEFPYVGYAAPANAQYRDAVKIKEAGFDFIRLSHYPQSPEFMAACDELGIVCLSSPMGWQFNPGTPEFMENRVQAMRDQVRRDRNHPCAVAWETVLNESKMEMPFVKSMYAAAHEEFPGDQMWCSGGYVEVHDVVGRARQHGGPNWLRWLVDQKESKPGLINEYGDWEYYAGNAGFNQQLWKDLKKEEQNSRQPRSAGEKRLLQQAMNHQESHNDNCNSPAFADAYWVMYSYTRDYAPDLENSGVMDNFRLPKFSYWFYRSQREPSESYETASTGPMVRIASYWNEKSPTDVRVFSNCDEVELFLNGKSLGRQKPDSGAMCDSLAYPPFTFKLGKFTPGELKAVAYIAGKKSASHEVKTPGAASKVGLEVDISGKPLEAGGDIVLVYASIEDKSGTVVPDATNDVTFAVTGDAVFIGDNPSKAEAGISSILLKTGATGGEIKVSASASGLKTGACVIKGK